VRTAITFKGPPRDYLEMAYCQAPRRSCYVRRFRVTFLAQVGATQRRKRRDRWLHGDGKSLVIAEQALPGFHARISRSGMFPISLTLLISAM